MRTIAILLLMMAPAFAQEVPEPPHPDPDRWCLVNKSDNVLRGCWIIKKIEDYPAPDDAFYVQDPDAEGSPGLPYDKDQQQFLHTPDVPYDPPDRKSVQEKLDEIKAEIETLKAK